MVRRSLCVLAALSGTPVLLVSATTNYRGGHQPAEPDPLKHSAIGDDDLFDDSLARPRSSSSGDEQEDYSKAIRAFSPHQDVWPIRGRTGAAPARGTQAAFSPYSDVCTADEYADKKDELCWHTFVVSSLAYNPHGPNLNSKLTLIFRPTTDLRRKKNGLAPEILIGLPDFGLPANLKNDPTNVEQRIVEVFLCAGFLSLSY